MLKRTFFDKVGPFDERFRIAQDFDWAVRAARIREFEYLNEIGGIFTNQGTSLSGSHNIRQIEENWMVTKRDYLAIIFGFYFMDQLHDYSDPMGNVRYYHFLKARRCIDFLKKESGKDKNFLDAGAGRGPYSLVAKDLFKNVYCFELNKEELEYARKYISSSNVQFEDVDLTSIPLTDQSVNTIICSEVLEHIPANDIALAELFRVLKKDGKMLLSMPNRFSLFYQHVYKINKERWYGEKVGNQFFEEKRHLEYPFWKIEKMVKKAGFKIKRRRGANILPLSDKIRKLLLHKYPRIFSLYLKVEFFLSSLIPQLCSFYFLELTK